MKQKWSMRVFVSTAMLAALAGVLMSMEFSIPMMPMFYKIDFSDVPSVIALFAFGPLSAIVVEIIKVLIKLITVGSNTAYVGEFANLIGIVLYIVPIWFIFQKMKYTKKAARVSLAVSLPVRIAVSCCINAFITLPLYAKAINLPLNQVIQTVAKMNPSITNLFTFIVLATVPFNLIKVGLNYIIGYILYDRLAAVHIFERRFSDDKKLQGPDQA